MEKSSADIFRENLLKLSNNFSSTKEMANKLGVPLGTLKCWLAGKRVPNLERMKLLADTLGCYTYHFLKVDGCFENMGIHNKNIQKVFLSRLNMIFINKQTSTRAQQVSLLNTISEYTLTSYFRNKAYHLPSLETLDGIAKELGLESYELIKEVWSNEKNESEESSKN